MVLLSGLNILQEKTTCNHCYCFCLYMTLWLQLKKDPPSTLIGQVWVKVHVGSFIVIGKTGYLQFSFIGQSIYTCGELAKAGG